MKSLTKVLALVILAASFLTPSGCAFFTAKRVAMMAGKHVAKKGYEKFKEDREAKERQERKEATVRPARVEEPG